MAAEEDEAIAGMFADEEEDDEGEGDEGGDAGGEDADDAADADEEVMDFDEDQDGAHDEL